MATRNPNLNTDIAALKRAAQATLAAATATAGNGNGAAVDAADAELRGPRGEWWWTGPKPWECPGFDAEAGVLR